MRDEETLCVSGKKVRLLRNAKKCRANKNIRLIATDIDDEEANDAKIKSKTPADRRQAVKLAVINYENEQVVNRRLLRIHQAVEVEDFERFLGEAFRNRAAEDEVLRSIHPEAIYRDHFGQYVENLRNVTRAGAQ